MDDSIFNCIKGVNLSPSHRERAKNTKCGKTVSLMFNSLRNDLKKKRERNKKKSPGSIHMSVGRQAWFLPSISRHCAEEERL